MNAKTPKRLFVIDAMALAFRSFFAFGTRQLTTKAGMPTSAVYGGAMFLNKLITEERPDYLIVAADSAEPTFRHELYEEYKAHREEMPEDLSVQMPYFFRLLEAHGCQVLRRPGVEADDLIGTIAKTWASPDLEVYIVSGDKDFMQLVNDHVFLYTPKKGEPATVVDRHGVYEKFSCTPDQVIDCLALIGDSSDNVPGVPGIGEKGAAKLISNYGNLENIYDNLEHIRNKRQRTGLEENHEQAFLSRKLVTIKTDVPLDCQFEDLICHPDAAVANQKLLDLFEELEFNSLSERVSQALTGGDKSSEPEVCTDETGYELVADRASLNKLVDTLTKAPRFFFDTETTGLDIVSDRPIAFAFSVEAGKAFYVPLLENHLEQLTPQEVLGALAPVFGNEKKLKIGHHLKFDIQMMTGAGVPVKGPFADTMVASHLLDASVRENGLDACCLRHLNYKKIATESLIGAGAEISMADVDLDSLRRYGCEDADLTLRLYEHLWPRLEKNGLARVFTDVEMPLIPVLALMEQDGVYVDADVLATFSERLGEMADRLKTQIFDDAGLEFNLNSPKQLQEVLFEKLKVHEAVGVKRLKKTKSGYSTDESVLRRLADHPIPAALLEYRTVTKLKSTYVDTLPQLIKPATGRIHTNFHQTVTATGRLSSSAPNLQNIPIRTELGQEIRKAFKPQSPDHVIISADYSQVELRLLAHLSDDPGLADAFREDRDIHRTTASRIFGVPPEEVDDLMRSRAKAINFGIIYGMGPRRLSADTGVSMAQASEFIEKYFEGYPKIEAFIRRSIDFAREKGYSETIMGRRRPVTGLDNANRRDAANAENIAVNSPIQGSAADLIKLAMIRLAKRFEKEAIQARMLLQVHDELVFESPREQVEPLREIIRDCMENAMTLSVPLKVEIGAGENWLEAH